MRVRVGTRGVCSSFGDCSCSFRIAPHHASSSPSRLFPRIDIAMHHGGAGTTGASLRAGLVTLIKPFFGDQFFWAQRVAKLGAGARVASLEAHDITEALKKAAQDRITVEKATAVGEKIRREKGVEKAIS